MSKRHLAPYINFQGGARAAMEQRRRHAVRCSQSRSLIEVATSSSDSA